jgi:glycosyltransferase involved in cell wall biosynthesis
MRILIDLQGAQTESRFRGIGRYSLSIAQAIARQAGQHEIWLVLNDAFASSLDDVRAAFDGLVAPHRIKVFAIPRPVAAHDSASAWRCRAAEHVRAHFIAELQPDVLLLTSLFEGFVDDAVTSGAPMAPGMVTASILYDLIPYLNPAVYLPTAAHQDYYARKIATLQQADLLLSISAYSREEAIAALKLDPERIVNISTAVDAHFKPLDYPPEAVDRLREHFGITRQILMYAPGGFDRRKNFEGLIAAFAALPAALREAYQLVIVSKINPGDRAWLLEVAQRAGLQQSDMVLTGYVPDEQLLMFYNIATVFVFPSMHEGFGLPVLEAMACGAAVIGSATTSVPEVIGLEEALFDPASVDAIAAKLASVMGDAELRARLREHGLKQAGKFCWDRSAKVAIAAIERVHAAQSAPPSDPAWPEQQAASEQRYQAMLAKVASCYAAGPDASDAALKLLADVIARNLTQTEASRRRHELPAALTWRIEGPFDSSYSLALLNRETALALEQLGHQVALHSTEGPGDFAPNPAFLRDRPDLAVLHQRAALIAADRADVSSRNLYPPRVDDMPGRLNMLHHYAWEESGFPHAWVEDFNEYLQGMTCLSQHVEKVMIDNGVTVPMLTSGCGVDHWERVTADPAYAVGGRGFRFLHVSSCFPRKGADVLIKAYGAAFTNADDVSLIIKTFANPHNEVHSWLAQARRDNPQFPDVIVIEDDLSDPQLKALLTQCHALVAPSRAEGFGMPLAEAMLSGLPVITTGWSGQLDFCNEETAWLVDYWFAQAESHFGLFASVWAEPDADHLAQTMREVFALSPGERQAKAARGRELLMGRFKWTDVAKRLVEAARAFSAPTEASPPQIGWISTWNTKCGIATYSSHLLACIPDQVTLFAPHAQELTQPDSDKVTRSWHAGEDDRLAELSSALDTARITTVVVQFNYGFFDLDQFAAFLLAQVAQQRVVIVMLHATVDPEHAPHKRLAILVGALKACHRVLVHSPADLNRLKAHGVVDNVTLFPHGVLDWTPPAEQARSNVFTIATYGFFLPHKGLPQLVDALHLLRAAGRDVRLKMVNAEYPADVSRDLVAAVKEQASRLGIAGHIEFLTDFAEDQESLTRLHAADLIVFPYQNTGESSSGAVRYGLASGKPVAVTPLAIFDDVRRATLQLPGETAAELAAGLAQIIDDMRTAAPHVEATRQAADAWRSAHRYSRLGGRLSNMMRALYQSQAARR